MAENHPSVSRLGPAPELVTIQNTRPARFPQLGRPAEREPR
jgi:hypothetical protein